MSNGTIPPSHTLNRAEQTSRANDSQKSISISLLDIDTTILKHLEQNLNLQIEDGGVVKKVKCSFGSPELWKAMRSDSFVRDYQGKITLPSIILKRTNSDSDDQMSHFNRYLQESVIRTYSPKNKYTRFSILNGSNAPINEIYNITFPSHMKLTYHFVIWTEKIEQMNKLVEIFQFNTKDYWGNIDGYKFRVSAPSFGHTVELQSDDDRLVKTEFDLNVYGYIIPESIVKLDSQDRTFQKRLTPKKIILGLEIVASDFDFEKVKSNASKWKNQSFPNKDKNEIIPTAPISISNNIKDSSIVKSITNTLNAKIKVSVLNANSSLSLNDVSNRYLRIVDTPPSVNQFGQDGDVSYDDNYLYLYSNNQWRRVAISDFS